MRRVLYIAAFLAFIMITLALASCGELPGTPPAPDVGISLGTPLGTSAQATLAAALTQVQINANYQAAESTAACL